MKNTRIDNVIEIAKEAGEIALRHFGRLTPELKEDRSLVTAADVEAGEYISRRLKINFPDYGIINEEGNTDGSDVVRNHQYTWVVDPIDGTASYSSRLPIWGICIGLLKGTKPVLGVIYLPVPGELYYTDEDLPAVFKTNRWGEEIMDISSTSADFGKESLLLVVSYAHRRLDLNFRGKARSLGSTAAHIAYVSRGDASATIIKGSLWDIVPGQAILEKAGGIVKNVDGSDFEIEEVLSGGVTKKFLVMGAPMPVESIIRNTTTQQ